MTKEKIIEWWAWIGVVLIVVAFGLNNFGILTNKDPLYQIMNIVGSLGLMIDSFGEKDYQPAVLNFVWLLIAVIALVSIFI